MTEAIPPSLCYPQLRPKQEAILTACRRYHLLTAEQITRLLWGGKCLNAAKAQLTELRTTLRLLQHTQQFVRAGRGPFVYYLSGAGLRYLAALGYEIGTPPHQRQAPKQLHLQHTLAVNDTLIAVERFARRQPSLPLRLLVHERELKGFADVVTLGDGTTTRAEPDGVVVLGVRGELPVIFEVDRGTEETFAVWRRKLDGLLAWYRGPYQQRFHTTTLTVAIVVHDVASDVNPALRLATLRAWTAQALAELKHTHYRGNVFLTDAPPDTTDPDTLFLAPVWYNPTGAAPVTLLPV